MGNFLDEEGKNFSEFKPPNYVNEKDPKAIPEGRFKAQLFNLDSLTDIDIYQEIMTAHLTDTKYRGKYVKVISEEGTFTKSDGYLTLVKWIESNEGL